MLKKILLLNVVILYLTLQASDEHYLLQTLCNVATNGYAMQTWSWLTSAPTKSMIGATHSLIKNNKHEATLIKENKTNALFRAYPSLENRVAWLSFGDFPTPIMQLHSLGQQLGNNNIFIKRDDLTGTYDKATGLRSFGGNKIRKLEFLLADAQVHGATTVITFGCAGSNHVAATATYAKKFNMSCIALLKPQPAARGVFNNILWDQVQNALLRCYPNDELRNAGLIDEFLRVKQVTGIFPYVIPTGGSSPIGILGFVNAAFELKEQIDQGLMPEPDYIYVAAGSFGTTAGLLVGLHAAHMKTKIIPVFVKPEIVQGEAALAIARLATATNELICSIEPTFPAKTWFIDEISIELNFAGKGYGEFTQEAVDAIKLLKQTEQICLDGTYSGKAFAAMLSHLRENKISKNAVILFWNTYTCQDFTKLIDPENTILLCQCLREYLNEPVQELDIF